MSVLQDYGKEIFSLASTTVVALINAAMKPRAKLTYGSPFSFTYLVQQPLVNEDGKQVKPTQTVATANILVQNTGREAAKNVEIVFNWEPLCLNVWPQRVMETTKQADGRYIVKLPTLAPKEFVHCNILALNAALPDLIHLRSEGGVAENIGYMTQAVISKIRIRIALTLMFLGAAATVYIVLTAAQLLAQHFT